MNVIRVMESDSVDNMLVRDVLTALARDEDVCVVIKGEVILRKLVLEAGLSPLSSSSWVFQVDFQLSIFNMNIDCRVLKVRRATTSLLHHEFLISNFRCNPVFSCSRTF